MKVFGAVYVIEKVQSYQLKFIMTLAYMHLRSCFKFLWITDNTQEYTI